MTTQAEPRGIDGVLLAAGLSFGAAVVNVGDTVARLLSYYVVSVRYPLPLELKSGLAAFQLLCAFWVLWASGPLRRALPPDVRGKSWEVQPVLLGLVTLLFVFDVGGFGRYADPFGLVTGFLWTVGFLAIAYLLWDLRGTLRQASRPLARWAHLLLVALALVYVTRSLEFFYFWTQTLFDFAQPVSVAYLSLYGPHVLGVFALGLLWWWSRTRAVREGRRPLWRDLLVGSLLALALLTPPILVVTGHKLPEIVIRAFAFYTLGYSGYQWPSASLFLAAIPLYGDAIATLWPGRNARASQWLWWVGVASFPWNGTTALLLGYTSIPGSIVSLDAVLLGTGVKAAANQAGVAAQAPRKEELSRSAG